MKILEWMQKKLNGSHGKKKPSSISATYYMQHEPCKHEFSDWPLAILAIGTFGNNNLKEEAGTGRTNTTAEDTSSFQDCVQEFMLEEVGNLQKELNIYLRGQVESNLAAEQEENPNDLINKRLNSKHSMLEPEGKENEKSSDGSNINRVNFYPSSNLIYSRGIDHRLDNSKRSVENKSLFLLLKKMLVCSSGFQPTPLFKDPLTTESRMEKILRAIFHKKIYPQGSSSTMSIKKYLQNKPMPQSDDGDDDDDDDDDDEEEEEEEEEEPTTAAGKGSKWVKTDSEYIVLEI